MLLASWEKLQIDTEKEFKSFFVTYTFDGSEAYLVSDKLYALIGEEMLKFRKDLRLSKPRRKKQKRRC